MQRFYSAANLPEAYLVRDLLAQAGIEASVFNEHAAGAAGELPLTETAPEVWLMDDADVERARALLAAHERRRMAEGTRTCPQCGEPNPATFDVCWRCGAGIGDQ
jgi:hypothetical protein